MPVSSNAVTDGCLEDVGLPESLHPRPCSGGTREHRVEHKRGPSTDPPNGDRGHESRGSIVGFRGQRRVQKVSEYCLLEPAGRDEVDLAQREMGKDCVSIL